MNIGIIGAGNVAKTLVKLIDEREDTLKRAGLNVKVKFMLDSTGGIFAEKGLRTQSVMSSIKELADYKHGLNAADMPLDEIDLIVDLKSTVMENMENDYNLCRSFIEKGKHVVSGNKGPVLFGYKKLKEAAKEKGVQFQCGCAACAALPSVITSEYALSGSNVLAFESIVNGTTNYVLSLMGEGMTYAEALGQAQKEGIAEKNPHYDVSGLDTAIKTVMLTNILWDSEYTLDDISISGIDKVTPVDIEKAADCGKRIKLVGKSAIENGRVVMSVSPEAVFSDHLLYNVSRKFKAVVFKTDTFGEIMVLGASSLNGAAGAVLRDIFNIHIFSVYNHEHL